MAWSAGISGVALTFIYYDVMPTGFQEFLAALGAGMALSFFVSFVGTIGKQVRKDLKNRKIARVREETLKRLRR